MDHLQLFWRILDTTCPRNFTGSDFYVLTFLRANEKGGPP